MILPTINLFMYRHLLADLLNDHYILETYEERLIYYNAYKFTTITMISILIMGIAYLVLEITLAIKNKKKGKAIKKMESKETPLDQQDLLD